MAFEDILTHEQIKEIGERGTPPTEAELALIKAQGFIDGIREGERARMERATRNKQAEKNQ